MRLPRILLFIVALLLSIALAFVARDLAYDLIVLPLSYLGWQLALLFHAVSEIVWWTALVVLIALLIAWQLVPELKPAAGRPGGHRPAGGQVAAVALWLVRSRTSNYFKWQLANRLGRVSKRLDELVGRHADSEANGTAVAGYLAAGLEHSFVDFPSSPRLFRRPAVTALDVDLRQVVGYLESRTFKGQDDNADSL
jgi:hypothetical protein